MLNFEPRHQQIVAHILDLDFSRYLTILIGVLEILMAIWILTKLWSRINVIIQIGIVMTMNILEFILVPDLLLWGRFNIVFAMLFCVFVYYNEFVIREKAQLQ